MARMQPGNRQESLLSPVHKIMATSAMDMEIDKTGCYILTCGIDYQGVRRFDIIFADGGYFTLRNQDRRTVEDTIGRDEPAIRNYDLTHDS
jgi:hypothetical protein